mmetsp:Transcript_26809/g.41101  ORF Transcript_26809/g.41101 Transcript_26809/m.41101 type:complete len:201 (-) Transcript_26809:44-646(-)
MTRAGTATKAEAPTRTPAGPARGSASFGGGGVTTFCGGGGTGFFSTFTGAGLAGAAFTGAGAGLTGAAFTGTGLAGAAFTGAGFGSGFGVTLAVTGAGLGAGLGAGFGGALGAGFGATLGAGFTGVVDAGSGPFSSFCSSELKSMLMPPFVARGAITFTDPAHPKHLLFTDDVNPFVSETNAQSSATVTDLIVIDLVGKE